MNDKQLIEKIKIRYSDIDMTGNVTVSAICSFLQEAAVMHANKLGISDGNMSDKGFIWVLSKVEVDVDKYLGFHDDFVLKTWINQIKNPFCIRAFEFCDKDGNVIGNALTKWLLINRDTRRPIRIPANYSEYVYPNSLIVDYNDKMVECEEYSDKVVFPVLYSDIDTHHHVNNVSYVRWILESIPTDLKSSKIIKKIVIEYKSEVLPNSSVKIELNKTIIADDINFDFALYDITSNKLSALAKVVFT